jgi:hypothetical protein
VCVESFKKDSTKSAYIHLLKKEVLGIFAMSESVKIHVNKFFEKYQIDCLFKTICPVEYKEFFLQIKITKKLHTKYENCLQTPCKFLAKA